jgi:ketosteroid isomerase-like protein
VRSRSLVAIGVLSVCLVGCAGQAPREFGKPDQDGINQLIQEFISLYNAKDAQKLSMIFTSGGAVMPPNASTARGTENVREYYVNRFAHGASGLALEPQTVTGVGSLAYASGDYRLTMAPPGGESKRDRGKFLFILRNVGGKWQLEVLMFSSDFAQTPAA